MEFGNETDFDDIQAFMSDRYYPPGQEPFRHDPVPTDEELREAQERTTRKIRLAGILLFMAGAAFASVGIITLYSHYFHIVMNVEALGSDPRGTLPEYAWCAPVGFVLLVISAVLRIMAWARRVRPVRGGRR